MTGTGRRRPGDGAEFVAAVFVMPLMIFMCFGIISLNYGSFQRQLIEHGAAHACDQLDPEFARLSGDDLNAAIMTKICSTTPFLDKDYLDVAVTDATVSFEQTVTNSKMPGGSYGHDMTYDNGHVWARTLDGESGRYSDNDPTVGHTDSWQVNVKATVWYHVPWLFPTSATRNQDGADVYRINIDKTYVVMRREEVA